MSDFVTWDFAGAVERLLAGEKRERVEFTPVGRPRHCVKCDVKWWGGLTCWYCGNAVPDA